MRFIRYNANPRDKKTGDCVVRAIAVATAKTWDDTYDKLCEIGKKKSKMPNDTAVYNQYLKNLGFIPMKQMKNSFGNKVDINTVIDEYPDDVLLIHCTHHLTCAVMGTLIDTWHCGYKTAGKFWRLPSTDFEKVGSSNPDMEMYLMWLEENKMPVKVRL